LAAALLGAREPAILTQHVEQALERVHVQLARLAVELESHGNSWRRRDSPRSPGAGCDRARVNAAAGASRGARDSASGVAGMARTSRPAWRMAFTTAGAGPSMGNSPRPLAPNGPPAYAFSSMTMSMGGVSSVVGMT